MWGKELDYVKGTRKFFLVALSHESVRNYYSTNFQLVQHHKYSLTEIEAMIPWERDVYVSLLIKYIKEENERKKREREKAK